MIDLHQLLRQARESRDLTPVVSAIPYCRFLGISMEAAGDEVIGKLAYSDALIGNSMINALHGGTLAALLESTAVFTLLINAEILRVPKTISITVEYLRSGKPVDTYARAEFTRLGRRVASVRAFAWQQDRDKPIAAANASFLLLPVPPEE